MLNQTIFSDNPGKKKRVTKEGIARQVGLKSQDLTPRKRSLILVAQENYKKVTLAQRRLRYANDRLKFMARAQESPKEVLNKVPLSQGARLIFEGDQRNFNKHPNARTWTVREKCFYLGVYARNPKTYRYIKSNVTAPAEKTLKNVLTSVKLSPGISPFLLKVIKKKTEKFDQKGRTCQVMFDEMFTNKGLYYNTKTDMLEGIEDIGERGRTDREADHVLVFMVRGINADWKMPVAFFPVNSTCPSEVLAQILPDVIGELQKMGLEVEASVSDQGPTNQKAISILRSQCPEGKEDPVYKVNDKTIVHLWDIPHNFKGLRNNLLTSDLEFEPGKVARWSDLVDFFKLDEGMSKISKLQYVHLCPLGRNKMRVDLAAQAVGETNASTMETFRFLSNGKYLANAESTIECIYMLDKLFDATNGPGRKDFPKEQRQNVTEDSFHLQYWREMRHKMEKWVFIRKSTGERHVPPCLTGYIENLKGLQWLWNKLKKKGFTYLRLRDLNQDPLENYFMQIRQTCGSSSDPTIPQFIGGMKICLVQTVTGGRGQNCKDDGVDFLADFESLIVEATQSEPGPGKTTLWRGARPEDQTRNEQLINKLARQAPSLTCATICSKILAATKHCEECKKNLTSNENSTDFTLQMKMERTCTLEKPSPNLTNFYLKAQHLYNRKWKEIGWKPHLKANVISLLEEEENFDWLTCSTHLADVHDLLLHLVSTRVINLKCSKLNTAFHAKRVKPSRQAERSAKSRLVDSLLGLEDINEADWMNLTGMTGIKLGAQTMVR